MELDEAESTVREENYLPEPLWIDFESRLVNLTSSVCNQFPPCTYIAQSKLACFVVVPSFYGP